MPNTERTSDQDACIIESVLPFLSDGSTQLFFCSSDSDFAVKVGSKGYALHPVLSRELPRTTFFVDLRTLVEALVSGQTPTKPTLQETEQAIQRAALLEQSGGLSLSSDARLLLAEAAKDSWGQVSWVTSKGGSSIRANNTEFVERGNPESDARWSKALRELVESDLLEVIGVDPMNTSHQAFMVTPKGFQIAYRFTGRLPDLTIGDRAGNEGRVMQIISACARKGVPSPVREVLHRELSKKDCTLANRYLIARPDGWFLFADDARPFEAHGEYYVVDLWG